MPPRITRFDSLSPQQETPLRRISPIDERHESAVVTTFNENFGTDGSTWLRPNAILNPRYVRFNATVDF